MKAIVSSSKHLILCIKIPKVRSNMSIYPNCSFERYNQGKISIIIYYFDNFSLLIVYFFLYEKNH
ncbi:putative membrane protein [Candidatus Phytoplasma solani]